MSIVASGKLPLTEPAIKFADLGPGTYRLQITTQPKGADKIKAASHDEINPGRFNDIKTIKLDTGQTVETNAHYVPFNPDAIRGNRTARVHIFGPDGSPAVGRTLKVSCFDGHYGSLKVFDGPIQPDGVVTLEGVTDFAPADIPFGPYRVEVDGEQIGWFRVRAEQAPQDFKFPLAPKKGDNAPDLELVDTQSNEHIRLKDLRGKVVFLEFWETGCGPCQPAMAKLNEVVGAHGDDWKNDVAVLSISFDDSPEIINSHVQSRGWTNLRHYWSAKNGAEYFTDAALRYVVQGVPTALLIDREGKIVWRGHPSSFDLTEEVKKLTSR